MARDWPWEVKPGSRLLYSIIRALLAPCELEIIDSCFVTPKPLRQSWGKSMRMSDWRGTVMQGLSVKHGPLDCRDVQRRKLKLVFQTAPASQAGRLWQVIRDKNAFVCFFFGFSAFFWLSRPLSRPPGWLGQPGWAARPHTSLAK